MFLPDIPINDETQDTLSRAGFGKRLGEKIRDWDEEESIVIALFGKWGSGKTSLLNIAINHILESTSDWKKKNKPIIIKFNPWNFSGQVELLKAFFQILFSELNKEAPITVKNFKNQIITLAKTLGLFEKTPLIGNVFGGTKKAIDLIVSQEQTLNQAKKDVDNFFRKMDRRVIIVIDDIDRLTLKEIRHLFQLVKLNADFPNTIYLMAFDREVVEKALDQEQGLSGRDYLEKIVQVGFSIPKIDRIYIEETLLSKLDNIITKMPLHFWDQTRWENLYHAGFKQFFSNLRDVKRFLNGFAFTYGYVANEVNPIDFIGLEALRIFEPKIYEAIAENKSLFATPYGGFLESIEENRVKEELEKIIDSGNKKDVVRNIIFQIFPQIQSFYGGHEYGRDIQGDWRTYRRICSPDVFDTYFLLGTPKGEISNFDLQEIIQESEDLNNLEKIFKKHTENGKIYRLLEYLHDVVDKIEDPKPMVQALLNLGDNLPDKNLGLLSSSDLLILRNIFLLLGKIDKEKRCSWFKDLIKSLKSVFIIARLVALDLPSEDKPRERPTFSEKCLEELKDIVCERISALAESNDLLKTKRADLLLYAWKEWGGNLDEIALFLDNCLANPNKTLKLLTYYLVDVRVQSIGDYTSRTEATLELKNLLKFIDRGELEKTLSKIEDEQLEVLSDNERFVYDKFIEANQTTTSSEA